MCALSDSRNIGWNYRGESSIIVETDLIKGYFSWSWRLPMKSYDTSLNSEHTIYEQRFENLFRVAKKMTSCLNISDILEIIRDEVKITVPHAEEACLILVDPDAINYTRPLHCTMKREQINCHMCKRGKRIVQEALRKPVAMSVCTLPQDNSDSEISSNWPKDNVCEVAMPIYDENTPLAVLNVVTRRDSPLREVDMILLKDLVELATNAILNAKSYSAMAREKLTLERILGHIRTFVPETVQRIIEKNPDAPELDRVERDVSILFLDLADYTRISEFFTSDKVSFIVEKYFSSYLDVIYTRQGDVNETAGDGLMAIFQGAEETNALDAVAAALEIRRRTMEINEELQGLFFPVVVNMGINSGLASVGTSKFSGVAGTRTTFTAAGSVTNLAARLAAAAKDGDILVGPETARRIKNKTTLFDRGFMHFKNFQQEVHVYSLVPGR